MQLAKNRLQRKCGANPGCGIAMPGKNIRSMPCIWVAGCGIVRVESVFLKQHKWDKGRRGRWEPLVIERFGPLSTANDLVRDYEEQGNLPASKRFFAQRKVKSRPEKSQQHGKKNSAVSALLAKIVAAPEADADIVGPEGRHFLNCRFILTSGERTSFMDAVRKLGDTRATQEIYQSVVRAAQPHEVCPGEDSVGIRGEDHHAGTMLQDSHGDASARADSHTPHRGYGASHFRVPWFAVGRCGLRQPA